MAANSEHADAATCEIGHTIRPGWPDDADNVTRHNKSDSALALAAQVQRRLR